MGTVYLGRMVAGTTAQTVAIKVLHPHLATNSDMVAMFLDEARVATRLRHPNLVGVIDMDMMRDELVIVMEYVEGSTLGAMQSVLRQRSVELPIGVAVRILCDALAGLHELHELVDENGYPLGLVHRDVSPHNLLVGSDGVTRVTDFGIALSAGRLASTRPDGTLKGKLQYLAPEQVGRKSVDRRVDVFAAGIVLWECLTGVRLFDAPTEAETVTRVMRDPIAPPSMIRPEVPTELDEVCLRALERDPARRFGSAGDFADALRLAFAPLADASEVGILVCDLASEAIRMQRESLDRALLAPQRERRRMRRLAAVGVACLLLGSVAFFSLSSRRTAAKATELSPPPISPTPASSIVSDEPRATPPLTSMKPSAEPDLPNPAPTKSRNAATHNVANRPPAKLAPKPPRPFMPSDL
jgi:serine/threonine protein kinase